MAETVTMPKLGFDMAEGTLIRWVVAEGESISKGAILAEIETDKATVEVESSYEGILARHLVSEGDVVPVNTPIAVIVAPGEEVPTDKPKEVQAAPVKAVPDTEPAAGMEPAPAAVPPDADTLPGGVKASPLARRIAEEKGMRLKDVREVGRVAGSRRAMSKRFWLSPLVRPNRSRLPFHLCLVQHLPHPYLQRWYP
jgi:pyruvate dehydrogenase E2 component (dihydrolipoamide acetyltransferase)